MTLTEELGNAEVLNDIELGKKPTHIVIGGVSLIENVWKCTPTVKYYFGLSLGCFIVREAWLDECESLKAWVDESPFIVYSVTSKFPPSRPISSPLIFKNMKILLGPFSEVTTFTKIQARELLEINGAHVIDVGGQNDGSGIIFEDFSVLEEMNEKFVLVAHPSHLLHENNSCSFCEPILKAFKMQVKVVECSWIMVCLDNLRVEDFGDRLLSLY